MNEPKELKEMERWIKAIHEDPVKEATLREVLRSASKSAPVGAIAAAAQALLDFNREEWLKYQKDNQ